VPYSSNSELPAGVRAHLPSHAQDIYRTAFNHAGRNMRPMRDERTAWPGEQ